MNTTDFSKIDVEPGAWLQLYRGAMRGGRAELLQHLDAATRLRAEGAVAGVVLHGFPRELEKAAAGLAAECLSRGLPYGFSWGLDGSVDNDGTRLTAVEKGDCIGRVLGALPTCRMGGINNETKWDKDEGPLDDMDEQGALDMGVRIRTHAPNAVLFNQPWPAIEQHGDVRKTPKPIGQGGVFAGYPVDEMATYVQFFADQRYWENWTRADRYAYLNAWADREWAHINAALEKVGIRRPQTVTIQGYRHDEKPWTVVDAVLSRRDRPVIVWSDPYPTTSTVQALRVGPALAKRGFLTPKGAHIEAIKAFQRDAKLAVDGLAGKATIKALGL